MLIRNQDVDDYEVETLIDSIGGFGERTIN